MSVHSSSRPAPFKLQALALVALSLLAACSKESATAPAAPLAAASDAAASDALAPLPAPVAVAAQAPVAVQGRSYSNAPTVVDSNQPPYVDESSAGAPSYADDSAYADDEQQQVVSVYVDPPLEQPAPIAVDWAPPPMLVEEISPQSDPDAVWTGGYWGWQGRWVWCAGRWSRPPRPQYTWHEPYYEHRDDKVVYVPAYWSPPERHFIAPAIGIAIVAAVVAVGIHAGHHAEGPQGVFIPPPPGSRPGIIVPAPIGTPPSVVIGAPPVINVGMRVNGNVENNSHNVTNNVTNITNVRNVTIVAPKTATANGRGFQQAVAADPHRPPMVAAGVRPTAPTPRSTTPVAAWQPGHPAPVLPAAQPVRGGPPRGEASGRPGVPPPNGQQAQAQAQAQRAQQEQAQQQAGQQRAQQEQAQRAQQQQKAQQEQAQKAQQEQAQRAQQQAQQQKAQQDQARKAQQEQAQRAQQQAQQQKAQQEQSQRAQQQAQLQKAQQEQAQRAQQVQQQAQQQAQQRAQQEQAAKANEARAAEERAQADKAKRDADAKAHTPPERKPTDNDSK